MKWVPTLTNVWISAYHGLIVEVIWLFGKVLLVLQLFFQSSCFFYGSLLLLSLLCSFFGSLLCFLLFMNDLHLLNFFFLSLPLLVEFKISPLSFELGLHISLVLWNLLGRRGWHWVLRHDLTLQFLLFSMECWSLIVNYFPTVILRSLRSLWLRLWKTCGFGIWLKWSCKHRASRWTFWLFCRLRHLIHTLCLYIFCDYCLFRITSTHFQKFKYLIL